MGIETALMIGGAGSIMSADAARQQGKDAQRFHEANAKVLRSEADAQIEKGREEASIMRQKARAMLASQIAAAGAGGGDVGGSTAIIMGDGANNAERDVQMTLRNSQLDAQSLRNKANIEIAYGKSARKAGNIRAMTNLIQGGSNMLGLYASYSQMGGGIPGGGTNWSGMNHTPGLTKPTHYGTMYA